jgi:hypothetical protein
MDEGRDLRGVLMGVGMGNPEGGVIDIFIAGAMVDSLPSSPFLEGFLEARVKYPLRAFILSLDRLFEDSQAAKDL